MKKSIYYLIAILAFDSCLGAYRYNEIHFNPEPLVKYFIVHVTEGRALTCHDMSPDFQLAIAKCNR